MAKQWHLRGLYIVTPDWDDTDKLVAATEQAIQGGAMLVQYRHKTASAILRREQANTLLQVCRRHSVPFIVNDDVELCLQLDADGIHVGGTDAGVAQVRAMVGRDKIVGASCYGSLQRARDACQAGATYMAFGGFYSSRVKKYTFKTEPCLLAEAKRDIALPAVVIGGMTVENCQALIEQGADMVAAISSVYMNGDIGLAASRFAGLFFPPVFNEDATASS